jgi:hypothetical protein
MSWENLDLFMTNKRHYFWLGAIKVLPWFVAWIPRRLRRLGFYTIASISPDVPYDLQRLAKGSNGWSIFGYGFLAGVILCFGMTMLLTMIAGTWTGPEPNMVYFRDDWQNIVLYLIVCPAYVGWCSWIIALFLGRSTDISNFADDLGESPHRFWIARFPIAFITIVLLTVLIVFNYVSDILEVNNVPEAYWFMTRPIQGIRYLNKVGIYYVILNFSLLLITVTAIFCFFSIFFEAIRVGHGGSEHSRPKLLLILRPSRVGLPLSRKLT